MKWSETFYKIVASFDPKNHPVYALLAMMVISMTVIAIVVLAGTTGTGLAVGAGITGKKLVSMIPGK